MQAFVCSFKPKSVNVKPRFLRNYKAKLKAVVQGQGATKYGPSDSLYGVIYYFATSTVDADIDADNISKPVWDALQGIIYDNDFDVRLRTAGVVVMKTDEVQTLDFTRVPESAMNSLLVNLGSAQHLLYIEVGHWTHSLVGFGLELDTQGGAP